MPLVTFWPVCCTPYRFCCNTSVSRWCRLKHQTYFQCLLLCDLVLMSEWLETSGMNVCLQVQDTSASPTLSRLLTAGVNRGSSIKSDRSSNSLELPPNTVGVDSLCAEMNNLMHEFEVVSRIAELVSTLKGSYKVCCEANFKALVNNLLLYNVEPCNWYSLWSVVMVLKWRKIRCAEHVLHMGRWKMHRQY
jgi:hypothetical protein